MKTVDELMDRREPGKVKITKPNWDPDMYFVPYYKTIDLRYDKGDWWGVFYDGDTPGGLSKAYLSNVRNWKIYQEPVKKVKQYLWAVPEKPEESGTNYLVTVYFHTEDEAGPDWIKLEHSMIEVED